MDIDLRELRLQGPERVFVPLQRQLRMQAALQQDLIPAESHRLFDLLVEGLQRKNISFDVIDRPVERTEVAHRRADVRVVDVSIDVVGAVVLRMQAARDGICSGTDRGQVVRPQQLNALVGSQPLAGNGLVQDAFNAGGNAGDHGRMHSENE